jgi:hypothetical protein
LPLSTTVRAALIGSLAWLAARSVQAFHETEVRKSAHPVLRPPALLAPSLCTTFALDTLKVDSFAARPTE